MNESIPILRVTEQDGFFHADGTLPDGSSYEAQALTMSLLRARVEADMTVLGVTTWALLFNPPEAV